MARPNHPFPLPFEKSSSHSADWFGWAGISFILDHSVDIQSNLQAVASRCLPSDMILRRPFTCTCHCNDFLGNIHLPPGLPVTVQFTHTDIILFPRFERDFPIKIHFTVKDTFGFLIKLLCPKPSWTCLALVVQFYGFYLIRSPHPVRKLHLIMVRTSEKHGWVIPLTSNSNPLTTSFTFTPRFQRGLALFWMILLHRR